MDICENDRIHGDYIEGVLENMVYSEQDIAFAAAHRDAWIENYLKAVVKKEPKIAVATFGSKGSLAFDGQAFYECGIYEAHVVNTVGAGDSFIAGFMYALLTGKSIEKCLQHGASVAAKVVSVFEPWEG